MAYKVLYIMDLRSTHGGIFPGGPGPPPSSQEGTVEDVRDVREVWIAEGFPEPKVSSGDRNSLFPCPSLGAPLGDGTRRKGIFDPTSTTAYTGTNGGVTTTPRGVDGSCESGSTSPKTGGEGE